MTPPRKSTLVDRSTSAPARWGEDCRAWQLVASEGLSVKSERLPAGAAETPHVHDVAHQFFFVLAGRGVMSLGDGDIALGPQQGIEVAPGDVHRLSAPGPEPLDVLVISAPSVGADRRVVR